MSLLVLLCLEMLVHATSWATIPGRDHLGENPGRDLPSLMHQISATPAAFLRKANHITGSIPGLESETEVTKLVLLHCTPVLQSL